MKKNSWKGRWCKKLPAIITQRTQQTRPYPAEAKEERRFERREPLVYGIIGFDNWGSSQALLLTGLFPVGDTGTSAVPPPVSVSTSCLDFSAFIAADTSPVRMTSKYGDRGVPSSRTVKRNTARERQLQVQKGGSRGSALTDRKRLVSAQLHLSSEVC